MREDLLIDHASPVIAGIKPANLFQIRSTDIGYVRSILESWEISLRKCPNCDLKFRLVAKRSKGFLVLAYRKRELEKIIKDEKISSYINSLGYDSTNLLKCMTFLSSKLRVSDFPHEIGLFLGYPLDDVRGFIENKGQNFLLNGFWKVYSNKEEKEKIFIAYKNTKTYNKALAKRGYGLAQLVN